MAGTGKALTPAEQKKRSIRIFGVLSIVFYVLCIAATVGVLAFSFMSISSKTEVGDRTILNGKTEIKDPCDDAAGLKNHRPLRFALGEDEDPMSCSWPALSSALRLALSFLSIGVVGLCFFFTFIHRSRYMYLFAILIVAVGVGFGYLGYDDSRLVAVSNKWCKDDMKEVPWVKVPEVIKCMYGTLILVPVMDFVAAAVWILLAFFVISFVCKAGPGQGKLKKGRLLPDDDKKEPDDHFGPPEEEDTPEEPQKKSGGGFFNFFGVGKKNQRVPDEPEESEDGTVNFEKESKSRFAPMSKTDKEAKDLPLGGNGKVDSNKAVGNALFNFEDASQGSSAKQAPPVESQPAPQQQPKPQQSGGSIDFEALAGKGDDPFA